VRSTSGEYASEDAFGIPQLAAPAKEIPAVQINGSATAGFVPLSLGSDDMGFQFSSSRTLEFLELDLLSVGDIGVGLPGDTHDASI